MHRAAPAPGERKCATERLSVATAAMRSLSMMLIRDSLRITADIAACALALAQALLARFPRISAGGARPFGQQLQINDFANRAVGELARRAHAKQSRRRDMSVPSRPRSLGGRPSHTRRIVTAEAAVVRILPSGIVPPMNVGGGDQAHTP
jgi:hypothetical protein